MSIGVALPLTYDTSYGFSMHDSVKGAIRQNFLMLIITNPGERVMEPDFGVGIKQFLFSNFSENIYPEISEKIKEQVARYIPSITVGDILYSANEDNNSLSMRITYSIPNIGLRDLLEFTI